MPSKAQNIIPDLIGGRYRIAAELGHGGMARVYRAVDERSGEQLALKRLAAQGGVDPTVQAMFEHEYHTLVQLAHPRIVRVFDYGVDAEAPYYTMELLDGADSRSKSRERSLTIKEVCVMLRDAASALALVHSRRLVHRDVSPRNLWCTPDGRAKLIDFGTLVAMGPQTRIAGTPPFVPPEAVYMQPLDARCDLYALGALAYFLLTKRYAYPAREIVDLRQMWQRRPVSPDAINTDVPAALSELVMSMLSLDPRGRPALAAEVCERLTALAELPDEDERHVAQAFLTSPSLVGREETSSFLRKRLLRAMRGRGGAVMIVAASGLGRSRMLESLVLEGKLLGAATIAVDARAAGTGPFALAGAIAERLLEVVPMAAAVAAEVAPVLGHISPALRRALGDPELTELSASERLRKLSSAFVTLTERVSRQQRLVLAVDDVHCADAVSLAALARLAQSAPEHPVLLATTCERSALERPAPALEQLAQADRVELEPLAPEHTQRLLASLFGVAGLDDAARWLHELSQGSPQSCMQYAQYLVDRGVARYERGQWQLPLDLRRAGLPVSLAVMFEQKVQGLSADARALALGLVLARDESRAAWQPENHIPLEAYPKLLEDADAARTFGALDELLRAGLLVQHDARYLVAQRAMVDALLRLTDEEMHKRAHARLARVFEQDPSQAALLTVRQLQLAGEHEHARERLIAYALASSGENMDWGNMRVSLNAECAKLALEHFQTHGGTPREGIMLRRALMVICSVYDWSTARFGVEQLAQLRIDSGLVHFEHMDPSQPVLNRTLECLKLAQQAYDQKPVAERGLDPLEAVREIAACSMSVSGAFVHSHDVARARMVPATVDPLRPLSPVVDLLADLCDQGIARVTGRELFDGTLESADRLRATLELPQVLRDGGAAVFLHMQAVEDARLGRRRSIELMERLVPDVGEEMFLVAHARWLAHAFRGDAKPAERCRKQLELITADDVWRRKAFLFVEAQLHALTGDLPSLHRTSEAIAELSSVFEGWRPWLAFTRAAMHRLHGRLDAARLELETALELAQAGEHRAWVLAAPAHAEILLLQGDTDSALRESEAIVRTVETLALDRSAALAAERVHALAKSARGEHTAAAESLERAFVLARDLGCDGLPLAVLYEAQARVALAAGSAHDCMTALTHLRKSLEHAAAPALVVAYESLRQASMRTLQMPELPTAVAQGRTALPESTGVLTEVQTRFSACGERHERAQQALQLLLEASGAKSGQLFLLAADGLFDAAAVELGYASSALLAAVREYLDAELRETQTAAVTVADLAVAGTTASAVFSVDDMRFVPVLVEDYASGRATVSGIALLVVGGQQPKQPRSELVKAISRCLEAAGDTVPIAVE